MIVTPEDHKSPGCDGVGRPLTCGFSKRRHTPVSPTPCNSVTEGVTATDQQVSHFPSHPVTPRHTLRRTFRPTAGGGYM
jgi:hypothetical protein